MVYHYLSSEAKNDAIYITSLNSYLCSAEKAPDYAHTRVIGHSVNLDTVRQKADVAQSDAAAAIGELDAGIQQLKNASWGDELKQFFTVKGVTKPQTVIGAVAGVLFGRYLVPKCDESSQ